MTNSDSSNKWIGYVRVSTTEQSDSGLGIAAQRKAIESYVESIGGQLVAVVEDSGQSGCAGAGSGAGALTHHAYSRARSDFRLMTCGTTLEHLAGSRLTRSDAAVQTVVDFMYRSDNTSTLSWGSTRVDLGGGRVEVIQARNRLQSLGRLWALYDREMAAAGVQPRDRVQRSLFYELAGAITARNLKVSGGV